MTVMIANTHKTIKILLIITTSGKTTEKLLITHIKIAIIIEKKNFTPVSVKFIDALSLITNN
ncbi:unnamed protein product, partial [marine sediment metagenome]